MDHALNDDLDARLRAARPAAAFPDDACDTDLLARVRRQPIGRRSVPRIRATPVLVAAAAAAAVVAVTFGGGPASVGGPDTASAVTAALRWFAPPAGTVLHATSTEMVGARVVHREFWQSADRSGQMRLIVDAGAGHSYEQTATQLYDPQTNTIYEAGDKSAAVGDPAKGAAAAGKSGSDPASADATEAAAKAAKVAAGSAGAVDEAKEIPAIAAARQAGASRHGEGFAPGDPIVSKIRLVLEDGHASVTGQELHGGVDAWVISLNPGLGRPPWTLWVARADGRPLELHDPGRDAAAPAQTIRWTSYDVLHDAPAPLPLDRAHPSAQVVVGGPEFEAAEARLVR